MVMRRRQAHWSRSLRALSCGVWLCILDLGSGRAHELSDVGVSGVVEM
jgi:hypothetical protein